MLKTLMLGNVIAQVATPVAAIAIQTTPMVMTPDAISAWRDELARVIRGLNQNEQIRSREIADSIPRDLIERHFDGLNTYSSNSEIMQAQSNLFTEFASDPTTPSWTGMSRQSQVLATTMVSQFRNYFDMKSAEYLRNQLESMGHYQEASQIQNLVNQFERNKNEITYALQSHNYQLTQQQLHNLLYYNNENNKYIIDQIHNGQYSHWSDVYNSISHNIHDLTNGINNIPDLANSINHIASLGKVAVALHLENMQTYQKIIMWVSAAFTLFLSIGVFMTLARVSKNKSSKKLKTLLIILGSILLIVAVALGVMPFIGGE